MSMESKHIPQRRRLRHALLLGFPALVLLVCLAMLAPFLRPGAPAAESTPETEAAAESTPEAVPTPVPLTLSAYSSAGDLYVVLRDERVQEPPEGSFVISVVGPDGSVAAYPAEADGTLYLSDLEPGLYTVRLYGGAAYTALPAPVEVLPSLPSPVSESAGWQLVEGQPYYFYASGAAATGLTRIGGRLYYFDPSGVRAERLGIDISYHNKGVNWPAVKAAGIDFVILRLGYRGYETGLLWEDERFQQNLRGAKAAGLEIGVYLYSQAVNPVEARQEADFIVGLLHGFELDYPIYFDTEQSGNYPRGRADRLSKAVKAQNIRAFCTRVRESGYVPGVYSGIYYFDHYLPREGFQPYSLWLANYTHGKRLPNFPYPYDIWQFTDRGFVPGIRGMVDMNAIF